TALPAIAGILRDLPAGMTAQAIIEVPDAADFQDLASHADVAVTWLARNEHDHGVLLSQAVRDRVPAPLCAPGPDVAGRAAASGRSLDVGPDRVLLWDTPQYRRLFGAVDEGAPGGDAGPGDEGAPGGHGDPGDEGARREGGAGREGAGEAPGATVRPFYAWIAGESGVVKELRRYLVRECGIDREQVAFMGYWKQGVAQA
ncbi:MAG: siderophore-interacting protein, partial [Sinomonas sp.]|nr:siderophore-interacting protein [Sinomonas sp.]